MTSLICGGYMEAFLQTVQCTHDSICFVLFYPSIKEPIYLIIALVFMTDPDYVSSTGNIIATGVFLRETVFATYKWLTMSYNVQATKLNWFISQEVSVWFTMQ